MVRLRIILFSFVCVCVSLNLICQTFYYGNDLSYANMMEDCGAVFKENGQPKDIYKVFADHGTNLVRVRLWYNPSWQNSLVQPAGVKNQYNDFEDARETIRRAKDAGMKVMLGIHLSDFWPDPGKQLIPSAWVDVASNLTILKDSIYNYVARILTSLDQDTLMPEIVKIGNENNGGILRHTTLNPDYTVSGSISSDWSRHAQLFNAAIQAVRDVSKNTVIKPKIALHFAGLSSLSWNYENIVNNGVTDFDIVGFSYYYAWHNSNLTNLGNTINSLKNSYPGKEVMVIETGYPWTLQNFDGLGNIIVDPDPMYEPLSPQKQLEYMVDYTKTVKANGGNGVIFWEPDWVSTSCRTPWGQGSSQEHVAFFEIESYNFMENGGGRWTEPMFYDNADNVIVTFKVDMTGQDVTNGVYITGTFTGQSWEILPMYKSGNSIYTYITSMSPCDSGAFYFLNDSSWDARETVPTACALMWGTDRKYKIGSGHTTFDFKWASCISSSVPPEVNVTFKVDMTNQDVSRGVYVVGEMNDWEITRMIHEGNNIYSKSYVLTHGLGLAYYFLTTSSWTDYLNYRETVPDECADSDEIKNDPNWTTDRAFVVPAHDTILHFAWESCTNEVGIHKILNKNNAIKVFPVLSDGTLEIEFNEDCYFNKLFVYTIGGQMLKEIIIENKLRSLNIDLKELSRGLYILKICNDHLKVFRKIVII